MNVPPQSLPNPLAPQAWLPPHIAGQVETTKFILAATAGAWAWDVLVCIPALVRIYSTSSFKTPDIAHFVSRIASGCFIFTSLMLSVASVDNCETLAKAIAWTGAITLPLHTLPFFFCARAVFSGKRGLIAMFALLWLGTLAGSLVSPFFFHSTRIGESRACLVDFGVVYSTGVVVVAVNNSITFVAVSFHLMLYTQAETWSARLKAFVQNRGIGEVSRLLMQSGQLFIIPIVIFNIIAAVVNLIPTIPAMYRLAFVVINVAIQSCMCSRIHHHIKLGFINAHPTSIATSAMDRTIEFRRVDESRISRPHALQSQRGRSRPETMELSQPIVVEMSRSPLPSQHMKELRIITEEKEERRSSSSCETSERTESDNIV